MRPDHVFLVLTASAACALVVAIIVALLDLSAGPAIGFTIIAAALSAFQPRNPGAIEVNDNIRLSIAAVTVVAVATTCAILVGLTRVVKPNN